MTLQLLYSEFPYAVYEVNLFLFFITAELLNSNSIRTLLLNSLLCFFNPTKPKTKEKGTEHLLLCLFRDEGKCRLCC
jgi:hypothetical protein